MNWKQVKGVSPIAAVFHISFFKIILVSCSLFLITSAAHAEKITVAAAADLKFAMDEIVTLFKNSNPADEVEIIYGSSGKAHTQIQQGAPYDLFFSADIAFPRELAKTGFAASEVVPYAIGRIVLWSASQDATKMTLASLADLKITHVAIANPKHAPYGKRAEEALKASGLWEKVETKLIYGENITQAAQFVQSSNAEVGILALSIAMSPQLSSQGGYWLIPDTLHEPLEQGYIILKRAESNMLAKRFASYMASKDARTVMIRYGFVLPGDVAGK
jgi:molybdate transport system substrate-binding protein